MDHFQVDSVTDSLITAALAVQVSTRREDWTAPESRLMSSLLALHDPDERRAALRALQVGWRRTFVEALRPTHLPGGWCVDHDGFEHGTSKAGVS